MTEKYKSVKEIADMFGFKVDDVRNKCHARGQKFALRFVPNGKFWIDPVKFREYIERKVAV